ncbi:acyltransferase family protein [Escherichia coli]|uniref:acyltransferase family protein n=1 Tax=Escherichia coli TaxID=562 RepID=UPI002486C62F|nr:acyltransferase family protein [Escherichia coli]
MAASPAARIKRIIPALIAISMIVVFLGYFLIEPLSYQMIGNHVKSSLLFISNIVYRDEAGYFDTESSRKYLLHTWSLSVEWQFYLIYPLLVIFAKRALSFSSLKKIVLVAVFVLFFLNIYVTKTDPTSSYYMLYSRAWEMLLGGLAFLYPAKSISNRTRNYGSVLCLAALIGTFFILDNQDPWPGYYALLPVVLAFGIILLNGSNALLSNKVMQYIGLISYSIYLVHWPLLVFNRTLNFGLNFISYVVITFAIATLIYMTFESKRRSVIFTVVLYSIALGVAWKVSVAGVTSRVNTEFQLTKQQFRNKFEGHAGLGSYDKVDYFNSTENDFEYILIGDSHARHYFQYINKNEKVASLALDGCKSTENFYPTSPSPLMIKLCKARYKMQVDFINAHPGKPVILSQSGFGVLPSSFSRGTDEPIGDGHDFNSLGLEELHLFINRIKDTKHKLFVIGDTQGSEGVMFECLAKENLPINRIFNVTSCPIKQEYKPKKYNQILEANAEKLGYTYISPDPALCDGKECIIVKDGMPMYTDSSHLSKLASEIVGDYVFREIKKQEISTSNKDN